MKKHLLTFILMASTMMGYALEKKMYELELNLRDGSVITFLLNQKVTMTFGEKKVVITRADFTAEYDLESIVKFNQKETEDYLESLERVSASSTQGDIVIYTLGGGEVSRIKPDEQQQASYLLKDLAPGAYVISNGTTTYKIMKQ